MRNLIVTFIIALFVASAPFARAQTQPATPPPPAGQDEIPDAAVRGDLMALVYLDFNRGTRTDWINAWTVIGGGKPTTQPVSDDAPLPTGLAALSPFFKMGVERMAYALSVENDGVRVTLCLRLKPSASPDAADEWLRKNSPRMSRFDHQGDWLVAEANNRGGTVHSTLPLNPRADEIRQDINRGGDDLPVKMLFLSSDPLKKMMLQGGAPPAVIVPIVNLFWKAQFVYVGAELGAHPSINIQWAAPDAAGADDFLKTFASTRDALAQPNNELQIPPFVATAFGQLQATHEDNVAYLSADEKSLGKAVAIVITGAMTQQNADAAASTVQTPVALDWKPTDAATDSASAQMRLILSAIIEYDHQHGALPNSLNDLAANKLVPGPEIFHNPRTNKDNGFLYLKPAGITELSDIPAQNKTPILYEEKDGSPNPKGLIGYADGSVTASTP